MNSIQSSARISARKPIENLLGNQFIETEETEENSDPLRLRIHTCKLRPVFFRQVVLPPPFTTIAEAFTPLDICPVYINQGVRWSRIAEHTFRNPVELQKQFCPGDCHRISIDGFSMKHDVVDERAFSKQGVFVLYVNAKQV